MYVETSARIQHVVHKAAYIDPVVTNRLWSGYNIVEGAIAVRHTSGGRTEETVVGEHNQIGFDLELAPFIPGRDITRIAYHLTGTQKFDIAQIGSETSEPRSRT